MFGNARLIGSSLASWVATIVLCFVALVPLAGCEQGEGQRCQTSDDCETGLVCPPSTGVCQPANLGNDGGLPPPDANSGPAPEDATVDAAVDAAPVAEDAAVDATPDAGTDAAA